MGGRFDDPTGEEDRVFKHNLHVVRLDSVLAVFRPVAFVPFEVIGLESRRGKTRSGSRKKNPRCLSSVISSHLNFLSFKEDFNIRTQLHHSLGYLNSGCLWQEYVADQQFNWLPRSWAIIYAPFTVSGT
jgi:hypothetical protein